MVFFHHCLLWVLPALLWYRPNMHQWCLLLALGGALVDFWWVTFGIVKSNELMMQCLIWLVLVSNNVVPLIRSKCMSFSNIYLFITLYKNVQLFVLPHHKDGVFFSTHLNKQQKLWGGIRWEKKIEWSIAH